MVRRGGSTKSFVRGLKRVPRQFRKARRSVRKVAGNQGFDEIAKQYPQTAPAIRGVRRELDKADRILTPFGLGHAAKCGCGKIKK